MSACTVALAWRMIRAFNQVVALLLMRGVTGNGVGGLAGGQIGCNYQIGMLVLGIEGEGFWSGMKITLDRFDGINGSTLAESPASETDGIMTLPGDLASPLTGHLFTARRDG
jgi:hypothetical protein